MTPRPCHYCNMLVSRDREGRSAATNPAVAEPWACPASPSGHLIAAEPDHADRVFSFTRPELIDAISRLEAYPATLQSGRVVISAESMADAIIEGLESGDD